MTRFVELCAGIGGFSLAAAWTGWEVVGQVEIDPWCCRVLQKHWPNALRLNDVREVQGDEWGPVDIVAGGIPCQPFSLSGNRAGTSDNRHLWPEVARILTVMRPRVVVVENVTGFIRMVLDDVLADLEAQGYACGTVVLPACSVGAPHRRNRVWVVAHMADAKSVSGRDEELPKNTVADGREARSLSPSGGNTIVIPDPRCEAERQPRLGGASHGLPGRLLDPRWLGDPLNAFARDWEDGVPRVLADCVVDREERLKALGNAIVPQVAYQLFTAIDGNAYV